MPTPRVNSANRFKISSPNLDQVPKLLEGLNGRQFRKTLQNAHKQELRKLRKVVTSEMPHRRNAKVRKFANLRKIGSFPIQNSGSTGAFMGSKWSNQLGESAQTAWWLEAGTQGHPSGRGANRGVRPRNIITKAYNRNLRSMERGLVRSYETEAYKLLDRQAKAISRQVRKLKAA